MDKKKPWGKEVDDKLESVLKKMISEGYSIAPISLATVAKRLGLNSRSTLLSNGRSDLIKNAKETQLNNAGLDDRGNKKRSGLQEQLIKCKQKLKQAQEENELLLKKIAAIMYNLNARGLDVEEIMKPLID